MKLLNKIYFLIIMVGIINHHTLAEKLPFRVGEKLEYSAKFNFIPAGKAFLKVISIDTVNNLPAYHVRYEAQTGPIADKIYKIRDKIDSWLDEKNFFTHQQTKSIREGKYKYNSHTKIFYNDSIALVNDDTIAINSLLYDPYSLFYYFRTLDLVSGKTIDLTVFDNKSLTEFQMIMASKERISVPAGAFDCMVVRPFREGKMLLKNEGDMTIWFSNDVHKIPVQIVLKIKYGTMVMKLKTFNL